MLGKILEEESLVAHTVLVSWCHWCSETLRAHPRASVICSSTSVLQGKLDSGEQAVFQGHLSLIYP